jgi:hypothetical protein
MACREGRKGETADAIGGSKIMTKDAQPQLGGLIAIACTRAGPGSRLH